MRSIGSLTITAVALVTASLAMAPGAAAKTRPVLLVGNNWDGTADVLDVPTYKRVRRINVVPDLAARQFENLTPARAPFALFVRTQVGEGHDQMVDDLYASPDGRTLYVSRPSFNDVVAINLATGKIVWRTTLTGVRADHMAISPDGRRLVVSTASAAGPSVVDVLDAVTGRIVGTFPSGDTPHENVYSRDGRRIFHASIGRVYTATDDPALDSSKGTRVFEIVDARTLAVLKKWNMAEKLAQAGYPNMSAAVRPMALSPDERWIYFQVSFFHGFVEFDLARERVTRVARLPLSAATPAPTRGLHPRLGPPRDRDERRRHQAVRGRDDVRLRRDRATQGLLPQHPRARGAHLLVHHQRGRALLLRLGRGRRHVGRVPLRQREAGRARARGRPSTARADREPLDGDLRARRSGCGRARCRCARAAGAAVACVCAGASGCRTRSPPRRPAGAGCGSCCGAACGASPGPGCVCAPRVRAARSPEPSGSRAASRAAGSRLARASRATTSCSPAARAPRGFADAGPQARGRMQQPRLTTGLVVAVLSVAAITGAIFGLREAVPVLSTGVVYLLGVLLVSGYWGLGLGIATAFLSAAAFNFFHIPPTGKFTIADGENWVALGVFFVAAVVTGTLAEAARRRAEEAEQGRREADLAAEMARLLLSGASTEDVAVGGRAADRQGLRPAIGHARAGMEQRRRSHSRACRCSPTASAPARCWSPRAPMTRCSRRFRTAWSPRSRP